MTTQEKCGCCGDGFDKCTAHMLGFENPVCDECKANILQAVEVLNENCMENLYLGQCGDNQAGPLL